MHSIKLKLSDPPDLESYFREFGKLKRIAYKRFAEGKTLVETTRFIKENVETSFDATFIEYASLDAQATFASQKELEIEKIIFGSRKNFDALRKGKISKDDWLKVRNPSVFAVGRAADPQGNRKFNLDIENQKFFFCPSRGVSHELPFITNAKMKKNLKRFETLAKAKELPITYRLTRTHIILSVDETRLAEPQKQIEGRILGIDLNPNFIGVSISDCSSDNQKIVHHQIFDLRRLNGCSTDKKKFEQIEISKAIVELARHYQASTIAVEKLEISAADHKKGKGFNKLINSWDRSTILNNLQKRCGFLGIKFQEVVASYSSFVGCLQHPDKIDSVAASLEIARRAHLFSGVFIKKNLPKETKILFPVWKEGLMARWKEKLGKTPLTDWKAAFRWFKKNPKLCYRVLFTDESREVFRSKSKKMNVFLCFD